jgi:hypothetical protein
VKSSVPGVKTALLTVEGLPTDPEGATGWGGVVPVGVAVIGPAQALARLLTHVNRRPLQIPGAGHSQPFDLHPGTLTTASRIILAENTLKRSFFRVSAEEPISPPVSLA